jgi:FkbM family methyltransferase
MSHHVSEAADVAPLNDNEKTATRRSLKQWVQTFLNRVGLYQRIKSSCIYDFYWSIADRRLIDDRFREVEFYRNALKGFQVGDVIFDVGANQGQKTDIFLRLGAKVVAVEPDERSQSILEQNFLRYRFVKKPVVIVGKALSDQNGAETMWIDEPGSAKNTLNPKWVETLRTNSSRFGKSLEFGEKRNVETVTLDKLIRDHGPALYVKVDVEGYEAAVLRGLRNPVPYVSFEANLPEFRPEALECIELLENLAAQGDFNYTPDCQRGLTFERWLGKKAFIDVLNNCQEPCIEVFWRAPVSVVPVVNRVPLK